MTAGAEQRFGTGPLSRAAAWIYTLLVVELLLLAGMLPGLVPLFLLDRDASNLPLVAACFVPLGPALSAALYTLHRQRPDLADLRPAAVFWRGYRTNALGALRIWVPVLAWLTIVAVSLANLAAAAVPPWWGALLALVAALALLLAANALVITSLFAFRTRDVARLSAYFLGRTPGGALGTLALLIVAAGVAVVATEAVLALLGSVFALALLGTSRSMIDTVRKEFTA